MTKFHVEFDKSQLEIILTGKKKPKTNSLKKALSTIKNISDFYFTPKKFEQNGTIYKAIGIKTCQKKFMGTVGKLHKIKKKHSHTTNYFIGKNVNLKSLTHFDYWTRVNESIHAFAVGHIGYSMIENFSQNNTGEAVSDTAWVIGNAYLVMLQRYNRERVHRAKKKIENRK